MTKRGTCKHKNYLTIQVCHDVVAQPMENPEQAMAHLLPRLELITVIE